MTLSDLSRIKALSTREKLELVDEIWISVGSAADSLEVTPEEKELLDSRWEKFLRDTTSALTVEQFKNGLNALRA